MTLANISTRSILCGRLIAAVILGTGVSGLATAAHAQDKPQFTVCYAGTSYKGDNTPTWYVSDSIDTSSTDVNVYYGIRQEWANYVAKLNGPAKPTWSDCTGLFTSASAQRWIAINVKPFVSTNHRLEWQPASIKPQGPLLSYQLDYTDGARAGNGYDSAAINLDYRFLLCADEIQVAYGIDRRSLTHSERYVVRPTGNGNFEYVIPASQPQAPMSVPLNLRVTRKNESAITTIGHLRDQVAGESLGMGCFTGQTQKIGTVQSLVGAKPTRGQIQEFLNSLILAGATSSTVPEFNFPLTNAGYPVPPAQPKRVTPARPRKH